jgi:hypothetical protein
MQRPRVALGEWLQHSTQTADIRELQAVCQRLMRHERPLYDAAAKIVQSGVLPDALFQSQSHTVNPALLFMMHACTSGLGRGSQDEIVPPVLVANIPADSTNRADVGEVWWLYSGGRPYLAEVWVDGEVPESRLPHLDRGTIKGRLVSRPLGQRAPPIKLSPQSIAKCIYSEWYTLSSKCCSVLCL